MWAVLAVVRGRVPSTELQEVLIFRLTWHWQRRALVCHIYVGMRAVQTLVYM